mmetsp:Transcript_23482/g.40077  ORF Transcript_23482/g.40077 Transcript_23482/m.40077 type:complete len:201 (+) Transcript_23482:204-806(+)
MRRPRAPLRLERVILNRFPDQSPGIRVPRADLVRKERSPHRLGHAHGARHDIGAARIRDQADAGKGLKKIGFVARNNHVAGQRQVRPCPRRSAIHRRNRRHGAVNDGVQHRRVFVAQGPFQIKVPGIGPVPQILTRAKGAPCPGQHDNTAFLAACLDRVLNLRSHLRGQRVHHVRPVQSDQRDTVLKRIGEGLVIHGAAS